MLKIKFEVIFTSFHVLIATFNTFFEANIFINQRIPNDKYFISPWSNLVYSVCGLVFSLSLFLYFIIKWKRKVIINNLYRWEILFIMVSILINA